MTTKIITAALAFFTTFGFSTLMLQFALDKNDTQTFTIYNRLYGKPVNQKVLRFLQRDIDNGSERMAKLSHNEWYYAPPVSQSALIEYSEAVSDYAKESGSMDDSELPPDLKIAWRKHMEAWNNYSDFLNNRKNLSDDELRQPSFRKQHSEKEAQIAATWYKVLRIAGNEHGAFPKNAY